MDKPWKPFTVQYPQRVAAFDPNRWTITRVNGVAAIEEDGDLIDEPPDTGQTDPELIRWGIVWCIMNDPEICLS
jgi:hypothetical protein